MSHAASKRQRIDQINQILWDNPGGLTRSELARRIDVHPGTITKYLDQGVLTYVYEEDDKLKLDRYGNLARVTFDLEEITMLHIAARLLTRQTNQHNPYAASALRKLSKVVNRADEDISRHLSIAASIADSEEQAQNQEYLKTIKVLTEARGRKRKVMLDYELDNGKLISYAFSPYFIEPYAPGLTTHVIGLREPPNLIRTFKIERLRNAKISVEDAIPMPEDFDPTALLENAWGIWYTDDEPIQVELEFSNSVQRRVLETQWHRQQEQPIVNADGSVTWRCPIAAPQEMLPWIRGWGKDVTLVQPESLLPSMERHIRGLMNNYGIAGSSKLSYQLPYAKTRQGNNDEIHLLLYHLIDVGQVALMMWQSVLTDSIRQRFAHMLNLSVDEAGQFIAFISALHDLGKAFPGYQKKYAPPWLLTELKNAGLGLDGIEGKSYDKTFPHGTVSTWALTSLLPEILGLDAKFAHQIAVAIGGHHGSWPSSETTERLDDSKYPRWDEVRRDLVWAVQSVFRPPITAVMPADKKDRNTFLTILSGLVSVADWVGSRNEECFGFVGEPMSTRQYAERSAENAQKSLQDLGWIGWQPSGKTRTFAQAFSYLDFKAARGVQSQVIAEAQDLPTPSLVIIEAPTGIGKTEPALYLADTWLQRHAGRGLYIAMPTQATSNQMYDRIGEFLGHRYPEMAVNYHLVHGQAAWLDALKQKVELQNIGDDRTSGVQAESWFNPRKRTLLAPFGVGTVDQTLMSILQTRHFFVRLFGLSHKVIIFDEVHAYDTFMSTLFHRLLEWLNAIGTSVILLSATLPQETRCQLVKAYSGKPLPDAANVYPALTIAAADRLPKVIPLDKPQDITLQLGWNVGQEPAEILAYLQAELKKGGCAAVICNTVGRAQAIYRALKDAFQNGELDIVEEDLILFHARFPPVWRKNIEETVLAKFGKPNNKKPTARPQKAIVIATQVIEQSLDLDFDLLLTDLAPIDLILQRAGRLHRHKRHEEDRHGHTRRLIVMNPPRDESGLPNFGNDEWVYEPFVLLRSYFTLHERQEITIPSDTIDLIEAVYGDRFDESGLSETWLTALHNAEDKMRNNRHEAIQKASRQLVVAPDSSRLLRQHMENLEEDAPEVHETFRAQTRDIDQGISLVCLHREGGTLFVYTPKGKEAVDLDVPIPYRLIQHLQQNTITVQQKALVYHFIPQPVPGPWQKEAALRHCRPVIFEDGCYSDPKDVSFRYTLYMSQKFGLEIIKQEDV